MNPTSISRTPLFCRTVRMWSSLTDRVPAAHVGQCADCRAFYDACRTLEASLRSDTTCAHTAAPATLEQGILRAVRAAQTAQAAPPPVTPLALRGIIAGALGVAGVAVAFFVMLSRGPAARPSADATLAVAPEEIAAMVDNAAAASSRWWSNVVPTASTAIQDNALQAEIAAVYADARSALDFLALNFLPQTTSAPAAQPGAPQPRTG